MIASTTPQTTAFSTTPVREDSSPWEMGGRTNCLDFVRFVLAVVVVFSHGWPLLLGADGESKWEPVMWLTHSQTTLGRMALCGFFALSGLLITRSFEQSRSLGDFLARRARRIYPGYFLATVAAWFVFGPLTANNPAQYWLGLHESEFLRQIMFLKMVGVPGVLGNAPLNNDINGASWTIRYEAWLYLLTAALGITGILRRRAVVLALFGVSLVWLWQIGYGPLPIIKGDPFYRDLFPVPYLGDWPKFVAYFLAGATFYLYRERIPRTRRLFGFAFGALAWCAYQGQYITLTLAVAGVYLVFYIAFSQHFPRLFRWGKPGDFSYGLYLWAWPIQRLLVLHLGTHIHPLTLFFLTLPPAMGCAYLSWHLVERRFLSARAPALPVRDATTEATPALRAEPLRKAA